MLHDWSFAFSARLCSLQLVYMCARERIIIARLFCRCFRIHQNVQYEISKYWLRFDLSAVNGVFFFDFGILLEPLKSDDRHKTRQGETMTKKKTNFSLNRFDVTRCHQFVLFSKIFLLDFRNSRGAAIFLATFSLPKIKI